MTTIWSAADAGDTREAGAMELHESGTTFPFAPKPVKLLRRILQVVTDREVLVFDPFAGSGTMVGRSSIRTRPTGASALSS